MNGWHRIVATVVATEIVALVGAAAGAGLLIISVFYAGGYALHAIERSDPNSLVNRRKASAAQALFRDPEVVIDLRETQEAWVTEPAALA